MYFIIIQHWPRSCNPRLLLGPFVSIHKKAASNRANREGNIEGMLDSLLGCGTKSLEVAPVQGSGLSCSVLIEGMLSYPQK